MKGGTQEHFSSWGCLSPRLSHCGNCSEIFAITGARESGWDKSSWAVKHHRVKLWLTKANKHLQQHSSHTDTQPRSCITAPNPNPHSAVFPRAEHCTRGALGHPPSARPIAGDKTPHLKWPPGPQAPWHTQGQVQPLTGVLWLAPGLCAHSSPWSCSRCPEQWIPHKLGRYP